MDRFDLLYGALIAQTALAMFGVWYNYRRGYEEGKKENRSHRIKDYEAGRNDGYRCFSRSGEQYLKDEEDVK